MNIEEIRNSGLLELYVLGQTTPDETTTVLAALKEHESLKYDIADIQTTLQIYAQTTAVTPSVSVKENLMNELRNRGTSSPPPNGSGKKNGKSGFGTGWIFPALVAAALAFAFSYFWQNQKYNQLVMKHQALQVSCDSLNAQAQNEIAVFNQLKDINNRILAFQATPKYEDTRLYIYYNETTKQNYLQVQNLPDIAATQSFQLWSIKGDADPIPLDVFQGDEDNILPIQFVDNTNVYAITIEPKGGSLTPNLEDLIGTVGI